MKYEVEIAELKKDICYIRKSLDENNLITNKILKQAIMTNGGLIQAKKDIIKNEKEIKELKKIKSEENRNTNNIKWIMSIGSMALVVFGYLIKEYVFK